MQRSSFVKFPEGRQKNFYILWFFGVGSLTLKGCSDGEKRLNKEKENKILCLEKSLIISERGCAQ